MIVEILRKTTPELEVELRDLSAQISTHAVQRDRFNTITDELKRRLEAKEDVQPEPTAQLTPEENLQARVSKAEGQNRVLALKVIEMEAEQARLVIEVEAAKYAKRDAEERLALVTKFYKQPDNT